MAERRLPIATPVVVATHNSGKLREIQALFSGISQATVSASKLGLDSPDETAADFAGNALLKAENASRATGQVAVADDSGLCIPALDNQPGVLTARWAEKAGGWQRARQSLHERLKLEGLWGPETEATLHSALALVWPDGLSKIFAGEVRGKLVWPERGQHAFGYDSMFVPEGYTQTFGEMNPDAKARIDARAMAFEQLKTSLA